MSNPSASPQQFESDAVFGGSPSLNEEEKLETPTEADTLPKSDPAVSSNMDLRIEPPITAPHVSPTSRRGWSKRKKGKGKPNVKKLQAIEEKVQILRSNLNPIPFIHHKIPDSTHHEKLLKKLGLWEFVHIDFESTIRADLIAQLVANYNAKSRCSRVNGYRFLVSRADLARAFKLPLKKEKSNAGGGEVEVELDWEIWTDDSVGFIIGFVSDWMLLHEDVWLMPKEVEKWLKLIRDGHPEKVDWAGLLWFMVEKELKPGGQLTDCYYASHLQHLIKFQREDVFLMGEEPAKGDVDNEENVKDSDAVESNVEGQDGEKEEGVEEVEVMDAESDKCKDSDEKGGGEGEEREPWLLNGENNLGEHSMEQRRNSVENAEEFGSLEERKDEEDEEMDGMEANQMAFSSHEQLRNASSVDARVDVQHIDSTPSFYNNLGKRVIEHDYHHAVNDNNKRLRINETWENKPLDFRMCIEQIEQVAQRARILYEEKEQAAEHLSMNQQILLNEVQKRDSVIEHLHKVRLEETQKKDLLERELYLMWSVLVGYRKALKETRKAFAEYRERAEEPAYNDAAEIERRRKKKEEEFKMNCLFFEQKIRGIGEECFSQLVDGYLDKTNLSDARLIDLEANAKELIALHSKRKITPIEEKMPQVVETLPFPEPEEHVPEAADHPPIPQTDEEALEVAEPQPPSIQ